jgi:riboflavin biosynthesis pyrimidine reductase
MVLAEDGSATGGDGTSRSLTSAEDRRVLRAIRSDADVVLVGAESIRTEGWFLPPRGRLVVLSSTGNVPWETCPELARVNAYPSISAFLHSLQSSEVNILCEGGITTAELVSNQIGFDHIALTRINPAAQDELPSFIHSAADYILEKCLTEAQSHMTFQFWRRAVEHL